MDDSDKGFCDFSLKIIHNFIYYFLFSVVFFERWYLIMYNFIHNEEFLGSLSDVENNNCNALKHTRPCRRSLEITNDYILIFDNKLKLTDISSVCSRTLKDGIYLDSLIGRDFFFMAPDMEEIGSHTYFEQSLPGDIYKSEDYALKAPVNKQSSFYSNMKVTKFENELIIVAKDITKERLTTDIIKQKENKVDELTQEARDLKIAVDILIDTMYEKQKEIERNCQCNLEELIFPILDALKITKLDGHQVATIDALESALKTITNPSSYVLASGKNQLTQREMQIANLIRLGKTTKQISDILYLSSKTVDFHRMNIRKRLNISNTKDNLRSYLNEIDHNEAKGFPDILNCCNNR